MDQVSANNVHVLFRKVVVHGKPQEFVAFRTGVAYPGVAVRTAGNGAVEGDIMEITLDTVSVQVIHDGVTLFHGFKFKVGDMAIMLIIKHAFR